MPYRAELKRPDLKGEFRCSLCQKIFCHSSSLSRHRMQAHFKCYTCTFCEKAISSNETLRAHMLKQHQITRMFMCRCCNWAFPDKTSLHIHMQAMASGSPGNVSVIAKSSIDAEPGQALNMEFDDEGMETELPSMLKNNDLLARLKGIRSKDGSATPSACDEDDYDSGALPVEGSAMDTHAWLTNNFPQVDASGVGSLGGTLCLTEEEEEQDEEEMPVDADIGQPEADEERADSGYDDDRPDEQAPVAVETKPVLAPPRPSPLNSLLYKKRITPKRPLDSIFPSVVDNSGEPLPSFLRREESPSNTSASSCHPSPPDTSAQPGGDPVDSAQPTACFTCRVLKGKLAFEENRNRFLEGKVASLETKVARLETRVVSSDAAAKRHETDSKALRDNNDRLQRTLLKAQERALAFMQEGIGKTEATTAFLQDLLTTTYLGHETKPSTEA